MKAGETGQRCIRNGNLSPTLVSKTVKFRGKAAVLVTFSSDLLTLRTPLDGWHYCDLEPGRALDSKIVSKVAEDIEARVRKEEQTGAAVYFVTISHASRTEEHCKDGLEALLRYQATHPTEFRGLLARSETSKRRKIGFGWHTHALVVGTPEFVLSDEFIKVASDNRYINPECVDVRELGYGIAPRSIRDVKKVLSYMLKPLSTGHKPTHGVTHGGSLAPIWEAHVGALESSLDATCEKCGRFLERNTPRKRFCNDKCRMALWTRKNRRKK